MAVNVSQLSKFVSSAFVFCSSQKNRGKCTSERNRDDLGESGIDSQAFQRVPVVVSGGSQISSPTAPPAGRPSLRIPSLELAVGNVLALGTKMGVSSKQDQLCVKSVPQRRQNLPRGGERDPGPHTAIHNFSHQTPLFKKILDTPKSKCASAAIFNNGGYLQHKRALVPPKAPLNSKPHWFTQVMMIQGRMETSC